MGAAAGAALGFGCSNSATSPSATSTYRDDDDGIDQRGLRRDAKRNSRTLPVPGRHRSGATFAKTKRRHPADV